MAGCRVERRGKRSSSRLVGLTVLVAMLTLGALTACELLLGQPPVLQTPEPPLADSSAVSPVSTPVPATAAPLQPALHHPPADSGDESGLQPTLYPGRPYSVPVVRPVVPPGTQPAQSPAAMPPTAQLIPNIAPDLLPPQVTISVKVPSVVAIGQEMEYRLIVQNHSRTAAAHHVFVRDWVPADVELIRAVPEPDPPRVGMEKERIWSLKSIEPGGKREIVLTVRPTKLGDIRNCARVQCEHGQCVITQVTQPQVSVKIRGPREAIINEPMLLAVDVTNPTKVPAHEVAVTLALPEGYEFTDSAPSRGGSLGQTARYADVTAALTALPMQARQQVPPPPSLPTLSTPNSPLPATPLPVTNSTPAMPAAPAANSPNPITPPAPTNPPTQQDTLPSTQKHTLPPVQKVRTLGTIAPGRTETVQWYAIPRVVGERVIQASVTARGSVRQSTEWALRVTEPKMTLTHTGPATRYVNQTAEYQITVQNTGSAVLSNVVVTDTLPAGATLLRASNGSQTHRDQVQWIIRSLAPGQAVALNVQVKVGSAGMRSNRVTAVADRGPTQQQDVQTEFRPAPPLELDVQQLASTARLREEVVYVATLRNNSTTPCTKVTLRATLPPHLAVELTDPLSQADGTSRTFDPITLMPGQAREYRLTCQTRQAGDAVLRFEATSEQSPSVVEEVLTRVRGE